MLYKNVLPPHIQLLQRICCLSGVCRAPCVEKEGQVVQEVDLTFGLKIGGVTFEVVIRFM